MNNPYYNSEGYADPTAYAGTKNIIREENETERRAISRYANGKEPAKCGGLCVVCMGKGIQW